MRHFNYLIIGAGIIGLTIAREIKKRWPNSTVCIIEKEENVAHHSSGRNSGVLHAGFYYSANSLKAKFTKDGNRAIREYCIQNGLRINPCGKLVVAKNESELAGLEVLKQRADANGVELHWMDEHEISNIDPNAKTFRKALYSPTTCSIDPIEVCQSLKRENANNGVEFHFLTRYKSGQKGFISTSRGVYKCDYLINTGGLYADKIAHDFGFGLNYTILPIKGLYMKYKNASEVLTNIYPVPDLKYPFLGVHFTKTFDNNIKLGPTAIPAFWRENYSGFQNFNIREFVQILTCEIKLFLKNSFSFRSLVSEELRKYFKSYFVKLGLPLIQNIDPRGFKKNLRSGIRAQLLNKQTLEFVQDFIVEGDNHSIHVLNAVSPAFTCSFPFSSYVVDMITQKRNKMSCSSL